MTAKWTPEEEAALRAIADGEEGRDHGDGADSLGATEQQPSEPLTSWAAVDLEAVLDGKVPELLSRSDGVALVYPGKLHEFSGEPETGKGWLALAAAVEVLAAGDHVLYLDFEDSASGVIPRLVALGVEPEVIVGRFHYVRPVEALSEAGWRDLNRALTPAPRLAVFDGVTEGMALHGLDMEKNVEVAKWLALLARPLALRGAAVTLLDHVTKDREKRGRYSIGAQHKLGGIDGSAFRLTVVEPFGRGRSGVVKLTAAKDRPGYLAPYIKHTPGERHIADMHISSTGDDGSVAVVLSPVEGESGGSRSSFRPTYLMEQVSRAIEEHPGMTKRAVLASVSGNNEAKDLALIRLGQEGFVEVRRDGQAHRHHSLGPYREALDEEQAA